MPTTIDLTAYTALLDDDGSNTRGTFATKENILRDAILTPVQAAIAVLDAADAAEAAARVAGDAAAGATRVCDGRLTLTALTPVPAADALAATAIKWTPYKGAAIGLYDGVSAWSRLTFAELSLSIAGFAANSVFDVFAYNNAGAVAIETLAWTGTGLAAARATPLVLQDGVLVKSGATTRRYLGSFATTATIGQTEDSRVKRYVYNYYHRVPLPLLRLETAASWSYTLGTTRQAGANPLNQVAVLIGVAEAVVDLTLQALAANSSTGVSIIVGIGIDSTTTMASSGGTLTTSVANGFGPLIATLRTVPTVGLHTYSWNEASGSTGTTTFYGQDAPSNNTGLIGSVQ